MPIVESVPLTIFILLAGGTLANSCPLPVSKGLEFVLPNLMEIVGVNISLCKSPVDIGAGRNGTIYKYGADVYACPAKEIAVAHIRLKFAHIAFATKLNVYGF